MLVSIIIPNKDQVETLDKCIDSILTKTKSDIFIEIIIIENGSEERETFDYYNSIQNENPHIKVLVWEKPFNYSAINNYGAGYAKGEYLLFMNNDIEVINSNWLSNMLAMFDIECIMRKGKLGVVGPLLLYHNDTIQHAGVGINGGWHPYHIDLKMSKQLYYDLGKHLEVFKEVPAVTGACLLTPKELFNKVKGFDEKYPLALSDIDYCLKLKQRGYISVLDPISVLYHHESLTRGYEDTPEKQKRFMKESRYFHHKWLKYLQDNNIQTQPDLPLTHISIVTFNSLSHIKQSLPNIIENASEKFPYILTITDNGSTDGTVEYLKEQYVAEKFDTLILLKENVGVAKAQNIAWSIFDDVPIYLKYDPDVLFNKKNWLDEMVTIISTIPNIGALGYNCESTSYPIQQVGPFKIRVKGGNIGGASFMVRKDVSDRLGFWNYEVQDKYGEEDATYGMKVLGSGLYNCYIEDEKCMIHMDEYDKDYRQFKDDQRAENLKPDSNFFKTLNECRQRNIKKTEFDINNYDFEYHSRFRIHTQTNELEGIVISDCLDPLIGLPHKDDIKENEN